MGYIYLPDVKFSDFKLDSALVMRRSIRHFKEGEISMEEMSKILWSADGITLKKKGFRTAPSAGALYPVDIYVLTEKGMFKYIPEKHALEVLSREDSRRDLMKACLNQRWVFAPLVLVLVGFPDRIVSVYGERGIRYIYLEAGHIAQNIHLSAVALGLGSVPVGAFYDHKIKEILNIDEECIPVYVIPVGRV